MTKICYFQSLLNPFPVNSQYKKFPLSAKPPNPSMGEPLKNPVIPTWSNSLPPGSRFYPSEEQIVFYYLNSKNNGSNYYGIDAISEIDLYNFDPFNFPEIACFRFGRGGRRRHWYCYVGMGRVIRENRGGRRRAAGSGYWKKSGRVKDVVVADGKILAGKRNSFVFYLGDSPKNAVKTDWVMYEYALADQNMASFVLCRVFLRSRAAYNHIVASSCGDDSIATVHRSVGVQCNGTATSVIAESRMRDDSYNDDDNEDLKLSPALDTVNQIFSDQLFDKELLAILEEDFIELDDLLCPFSGID